MEPWQFDEWRIAKEIQKEEDDFQASAIGAMIINTIKQMMGAEAPKESDLLPLDYFVAKPVQDEEPQKLTPAQFLTIQQARLRL